MEHRCGYRRPIEVSVAIRTRGGYVGEGRLCEASASGARLVAALPLALHCIVRIVFTANDAIGASRPVTIEAEVVRATRDGFGLEWTRFAPEALRVLYAQAGLSRAEPARHR